MWIDPGKKGNVVVDLVVVAVVDGKGGFNRPFGGGRINGNEITAFDAVQHTQQQRVPIHFATTAIVVITSLLWLLPLKELIEGQKRHGTIVLIGISIHHCNILLLRWQYVLSYLGVVDDVLLVVDE